MTNYASSFLKTRLFHLFLILSFILICLKIPLFNSRVLGNIGLTILTKVLTNPSVEESNSINQAKMFLKQAVDLNPNHAGVHRGLGWILWEEGERDQAIEKWCRINMVAQDFVAYGDQLRSSARYDEALEFYTYASKLDPGRGETWYHMGLGYSDSRQWEKAIQAYRQAAGLSSDNRDIWYELGWTYVRLRESRLALIAFEKGLGANYGNIGKSTLYFWIGYVQQNHLLPPDFVGAWEAYEQALSLDDYSGKPWLKAGTFYHRGEILFQQGDWNQAALEFEKALEVNPEHYGAHLYLAKTLWQRGEREEAKDQARQAIDIDSTKKDALYLLGDFLSQEGSLEEARKVYAQILEIHPDDKVAQKALEALNNE